MQCRSLHVLFVLIFAGLLAGCGGGSARTFTQSNQLRLLRSGDSWTYSVSGTARDNLTGQSISVSGTATQTVSMTNFNGTSVPTLTSSLQLRAANGNSIILNTTSYFSQDSQTRDVYALGDNGGAGGTIRVITTPEIARLGSWGIGQAFTSRYAYNNGDTTELTFTVTGSETIGGPGGNYPCWKATSVSQASSGDGNATGWIYPSLGNYIQIDESYYSNQYYLTVRSKLQSTNVTF